MTTRFRDTTGTLRTMISGRVRDAAGTMRVIARIRMRDAAGTLRTVFTAITAALSSYFITASAATATITTANVTATPTGGTGPYTYAWLKDPLFPDYGDVYATVPTANITAFRVIGAVTPETFYGWFFCRITDTNGAVADSPTIAVEITRT